MRPSAGPSQADAGRVTAALKAQLHNAVNKRRGVLLWMKTRRPAVLHCIVTGLEHTGTTVLSDLIVSAHGLGGPFETGFLLAETPAKFETVHPFFEWLQLPMVNGHLELSEAQVAELLRAPDHAAMYEYVLRTSRLLAGVRAYVDKTPAYWAQLNATMDRAPEVPIVIVQKGYERTRASYVVKRAFEGWTNETFDQRWEAVPLMASDGLRWLLMASDSV